MPKVCLNMIVKNEAAIVERCLATVAPHVDAFVIADTGSTDDTIPIVERVMQAHGVPGEIVRFPFENFSQARNAALDAARASAHAFDYVLLVDADMTLRADDTAWRDKLAAHAYYVTQQGSLVMDNVRVVKRAVPARYKYPTHEVLDVRPEPKTLDAIVFVDHADGASRPEKAERDLRLLLEELERNPNDARCAFYVAQTYKDMAIAQVNARLPADREWALARQWFSWRMEMRGYEEERWYACYMLAFIAMKTGDEREFFYRVMQASRMRPHRAEPMHLLVSYLRFKSPDDARFAAVLAHGASLIPFPSEDRLFVEADVYDYLLDHELSIVGGYSRVPQIRAEARNACLSLAVDATVPAATRDNARENLIHYALGATELFGATIVKLMTKDENGYAPMNPSVVSTHDGHLLCNVRFVNYTKEQARSGNWPSVVDTKNVLVELNPRTLEYKTLGPLVDLSKRTTFPSRVLGFEDIRLFWNDGQLYGLATVRDAAPSTINQMMLLTLHVMDEDLSAARAAPVYAVREARVLPGPDAARVEKNWVPVARWSVGDFRFVYSVDETIVRDDERVVLEDVPGQLALDHLRGGSQAIPFFDRADDEHVVGGEDFGYLFVAHETIAKRGSKPGSSDRTYLHRLVSLGPDFRVRRVSDPFYFEKLGVEFCAGLARVGDDLVFSFGVDDERAMLARASVHDVREFLQAGFMVERDLVAQGGAS